MKKFLTLIIAVFMTGQQFVKANDNFEYLANNRNNFDNKDIFKFDLINNNFGLKAFNLDSIFIVSNNKKLFSKIEKKSIISYVKNVQT